MNKAVNFNAMKKGLGKQTFGECAVSSTFRSFLLNATHKRTCMSKKL